jgi:hypothetical protein
MSQLCRRLLLGSTVMAFAAMAVSACTDFSSPPPQLGHAKVLVVDSATNLGVSGITVDLYLNDRTTQWASLITSADGSGEWRPGDGGVLPQTYIARINLAGKGYTLAANETNDKPLQVIIGETNTVNFKLHKITITPPGGG